MLKLKKELNLPDIADIQVRPYNVQANELSGELLQVGQEEVRKSNTKSCLTYRDLQIFDTRNDFHRKPYFRDNSENI